MTSKRKHFYVYPYDESDPGVGTERLIAKGESDDLHEAKTRLLNKISTVGQTKPKSVEVYLEDVDKYYGGGDPELADDIARNVSEYWDD